MSFGTVYQPKRSLILNSTKRKAALCFENACFGTRVFDFKTRTFADLRPLDSLFKEPVSPYPPNLGGADSPPKFRGGVSKTPLFYNVFCRAAPEV